jgi:hypothetical protein
LAHLDFVAGVPSTYRGVRSGDADLWMTVPLVLAGQPMTNVFVPGGQGYTGEPHALGALRDDAVSTSPTMASADSPGNGLPVRKGNQVQLLRGETVAKVCRPTLFLEDVQCENGILGYSLFSCHSHWLPVANQRRIWFF